MTESAERAGTRARHCVRVVGTAKARRTIEVGASRLKVVAIDDRPAMGDVRIVVVDHPSSAVPIEAPIVPAPTEAAKEAYAEAKSKSDSRTSQEQPGIGIPAREDGQWVSVHEPWIVLRHVHNLGRGGLNDNVRSLSAHFLLGR